MLSDFSQRPKNEIIFIQKQSHTLYKGSLGERILRGEKEIRMNECSVIGILDDDQYNYQDNQHMMNTTNRMDSTSQSAAAAYFDNHSYQ